jgi:hypothetical protein
VRMSERKGATLAALNVLAVLAAGIVALGAPAPSVSPAPSSAAKPSSSGRKAVPVFDETLPILGTQLSELPAGPGREIASTACLTCHSPDILRQQRLDEKKWTASITKMVGWGAEVPDAKKDELLTYLVKNFGPGNDSFRPVVTRPVGR